MACSYGIAVRIHALRAEPEVIVWLSLLPLVALILAASTRRRLPLAVAFAELGLAVVLHGWLTVIHAWRLD